MTSIAWDNGPVFRSGAIGTGQACCCAKPCTGCNPGLYTSGGLDGKISVAFDVEFLAPSDCTAAVHNVAGETLAYDFITSLYKAFTSPGWDGEIRCSVRCIENAWSLVVAIEAFNCTLDGAVVGAVGNNFDGDAILLNTQEVDSECYPDNTTLSWDWTGIGVGVKATAYVTVTL